RAVHLAAEAELGVLVGARDARLRFAQARQHFLRTVADGRNDAHPGDDDPPHASLIHILLTRPSSRGACFSRRTDVHFAGTCACPQARHAQTPPGAIAASWRNSPTLRSSAL